MSKPDNEHDFDSIPVVAILPSANPDTYPQKVEILGVLIDRTFFVNVCASGILNAYQAMEIWDECMYDVFVCRMQPGAAQRHIEGTLRTSLGHRFDELWPALSLRCEETLPGSNRSALRLVSNR